MRSYSKSGISQKIVKTCENRHSSSPILLPRKTSAPHHHRGKYLREPRQLIPGQASWNVREIGFCGYYSLLVHSFKRGGGQNFEHFPRQPRPHIYELVCIAQPQNAARNSVRIHHHARETRSQAGPREGGTDMVARWLEPDY